MDTLIGTVPSHWQVLRMDQCCEIQPGPSGELLGPSHYVVGGIPVVLAKNVGLEGIRPDPGVSVSAETATRRARYRLAAGDVVLVRIGVTTRQATVSEEQYGWLLGTSCTRLRAFDHVSPDYLACYLAHPAVQEWLAEHTNRGVMSSINKKVLGALPLVLPPAPDQRAVVAVASLIDAKIRAHQEVVETTRSLRNALLPRLLSGAIMAPTD